MTMTMIESIALRGSAALFELVVGDTDTARVEIEKLSRDDRDQLLDQVDALRRLLEQ